MASKPSLWGTAGWWTTLAISIPFTIYAAIFVRGDFEVYRQLNLTWVQGKHDIAGLNILHHLRAWQIHAAAAELYIITGLFQFSPSFRRKFPTIHRVLGYIFVAAGAVSSFTGIFFLVPNTEFGPVSQVVFVVEGLAMSYYLFIAVTMAKKKKLQVHQQYMIRAASIGYSVISLRLFPGLFMALGLPIPVAMEMSTPTAVFVFRGVSELYIQRVLLKPKRSTS